jgi:FKBP-type peptidyl-prolyl cis-trans isomerase
MKYQLRVFLGVFFLCAVVLGACKGNKEGADSAAKAEQNFDKDASYSLGMDVALSLKSGNIIPDPGEFYKGFRDALRGNKTRFTKEEADQKAQQAYQAIMEKTNEELEKNNEERKQTETAFLAENSKKPGVTVTSSGLQYEVVSEGTGPKPTAANWVRVNYQGTLLDGTVFDDSKNFEDPAEFPLSGVIPGWTEGIQLMNVGSSYKFYIPAELGYGAEGVGPIPPYSLLIFEVDLLDIVR